MKHGAKVKAAILDAAVVLWRNDPGSVTASGVARAVELTHSAVLYHFKSTAGLRDAAAAHAVATRDAAIVPMLIAAKHPAVEGLTSADRARYLASC